MPVHTIEQYPSNNVNVRQCSDLYIHKITHCDNKKTDTISTDNVGNYNIVNKSLNNNVQTYPKNVVNLSDVSLSEAQISLLSKGLKFCPTPGEPDMAEMRRDLDNFHRKLKWQSHFHNNKSTEDQTPIGCPDRLPFKDRRFKNPSRNEPPTGPSTLEAYIQVNELELIKTKGSNPSKQNLTKDERKAIKELQNNPNIVIKPADKGGATVVLNKKDYIAEADKQLRDHRFYIELDRDPTFEFSSIVEKQLTKMCENGEIHGDALDNLTTHEPRTAQLYLLPKIHKEKRAPPRTTSGISKSMPH